MRQACVRSHTFPPFLSHSPTKHRPVSNRGHREARSSAADGLQALERSNRHAIGPASAPAPRIEPQAVVVRGLEEEELEVSLALATAVVDII